MVARLAAQRRTADQVLGLQRLVQLGADAARSGDLVALPALNTEFHRLLCDAANNSMLADTVERMSQLIQWVYTKRITATRQQIMDRTPPNRGCHRRLRSCTSVQRGMRTHLECTSRLHQ